MLFGNKGKRDKAKTAQSESIGIVTPQPEKRPIWSTLAALSLEAWHRSNASIESGPSGCTVVEDDADSTHYIMRSEAGLSAGQDVRFVACVAPEELQHVILMILGYSGAGRWECSMRVDLVTGKLVAAPASNPAREVLVATSRALDTGSVQCELAVRCNELDRGRVSFLLMSAAGEKVPPRYVGKGRRAFTALYADVSTAL